MDRSMPIVLLCSTCPFGGEVFLHSELKWVPEGQAVILYPIFAKTDKEQTVCLNSNIEIRKLVSAWSGKDKAIAAWNSLKKLIASKEYLAALNRTKPCRNLAKAFKFAYVSELRFMEIVKQLKWENEHSRYVFYSYWLYETAYVAARLKEIFPGSSFVSRCHGFDLYEMRHPNGYLPFREYLMESVDKLYAISEDGKAYIDKLYAGRWNQKVQVARLGTMDHGLNPDIPADVPLIVSCSNLNEVKRVDRIIEGLKGIKCPIRWYHFGDGVLRDRLANEAQKLPENIEWMFKGTVSNDELMQFYKENHVDAFVNVSASEGVPVSIMEAISFGIPVIATDVGGTHEILINKKNGYLLSAGFTNEMLTEAITRILQDKEIGSMRLSARRIWEERCVAQDNFALFYNDLIRQARLCR